MTATSSPGLDVERDAAQGVDGCLALAVAAGDVGGGDDVPLELMRPTYAPPRTPPYG